MPLGDINEQSIKPFVSNRLADRQRYGRWLQPSGDPMPDSTFDASSDVESASYLIGYRQAQGVQEQGGEVIDMDAYVLGAQHAVAG